MPSLAAFAPPCVVKTVLGVPCPGCGSTRAAAALARLDLLGALLLNPLMTLGLLFLVLGGLTVGVLSLSGRGMREIRPGPLWLRPTLLLAVAANWAWLILDGR